MLKSEAAHVVEKMIGPSASSCVPKNESVHSVASSSTSLLTAARSKNSDEVSGREAERTREKSNGFGSSNGSAITGGVRRRPPFAGEERSA